MSLFTRRYVPMRFLTALEYGSVLVTVPYFKTPSLWENKIPLVKLIFAGKQPRPRERSSLVLSRGKLMKFCFQMSIYGNRRS